MNRVRRRVCHVGYLLARHPRISKRVEGRLSAAGEEILASLLGAMLCESDSDRDALIAKSTVELAQYTSPTEAVMQRLRELRELLRALL